MNKSPLISVLIPVFNCEKYVEQCLTSILNQTYSNLEVLICDDGSNDSTVEIIRKKSDERIRLLINDTNQGNIKTINRLMGEATGEFIALQDADDWSDSERLESQLTFLLENDQIEACYTQMFRVDENGEVLFRTNYPRSHADITAKFPYHFHIACPSILISKKALQQVGNYPLYFNETGGADWYWAYLISEKVKISNLPDPLYSYRINPNSITQSKIKDYKKFFISKLIGFLIKQRKKHGKDGLTDNKLKLELESYEQKLKKNFDSDPIIQEKRMYVNARIAGKKEERKRAYAAMWSISKWRTSIWFITKPFSMLLNKIRISLS